MIGDNLSSNIVELQRSWTIFTVIWLIVIIIILFGGGAIGFSAQQIADEEDPEESREHSWIPLTYIFFSLLICGILTLIVVLLYHRHIRSIPELYYENINSLMAIYIIFFALFISSIIFPLFGLASLCAIPVFLVIMIIVNINLILHSKRLEKIVEQIQIYKNYRTQQNIQFKIYPQDFCNSCGCAVENPYQTECPICGHKRDRETLKKYCSYCQYPLKYIGQYNRYYCEVCKKYSI